jgi:DNA-binding response OmpR family regulator
VEGKTIELTKKEFELLFLLASHPGRIYTRGQLLDLVWGGMFEGCEHTVTSHMNRLRTKLEKATSQFPYLVTIWGVGYKFNEAVQTSATSKLSSSKLSSAPGAGRSTTSKPRP